MQVSLSLRSSTDKETEMTTPTKKPLRSLSGIKSTGTPHLGNYLGMIRPAIALQEDYEAFYFVADYHALTTERSAQAMRSSTYEVTSYFLALGMDPSRGAFFRQSDVPEVTELACGSSARDPDGPAGAGAQLQGQDRQGAVPQLWAFRIRC
jgi:tryptophanyl-tRNA synthetase